MTEARYTVKSCRGRKLLCL